MSGSTKKDFGIPSFKELNKKSVLRQDILNQIHESQKVSAYGGYEEDDCRKTRMLHSSQGTSLQPKLSLKSMNKSEAELRIGSDRKVVQLKLHHSVVTYTEVISDHLQPEFLNMTKRKKLRWVMLVLSCIFVFANFYSYDIPAALQNAMEQEMGISPSSFGLQYTMYSLPNVVFPLISGSLQAKIGLRTSLLLFAGFGVVGQGLCTLGNFYQSYTTILIGRAILGTGEQSLTLGQTTLITQWFINYELPTAIGISKCAPLLVGELLNGLFSPMIYNLFSNNSNEDKGQAFGVVNLVAFCVQVFCFFLVALAVVIDIKTEKADEILLKQYSQELREKQQRLSSIKANRDSLVRSGTQRTGTQMFSKSFKQAEDINKTVQIKDIKTLGIPFWLTILSCVCIYVAITNSIILMPGVLQQRFDWSIEAAGILHPMPYVFATILSPIVGSFVHKYGHRMTMGVIGSLSLVIGHLMLPMIQSQPVCIRCWESLMPPVFQGFTYAAYAVAIFGSLPYLVEARVIGLAYGICLSCQNIGMMVSPPLAGYIKEATQDVQMGYYWVQIYFVAIACISVAANIIVWIYDKKNRDNTLQSSNAIEKFERYTQTKYLQNGEIQLLKDDPENQLIDINPNPDTKNEIKLGQYAHYEGDSPSNQQQEKMGYEKSDDPRSNGAVLCDFPGIGTEEQYTESQDESNEMQTQDQE